MSLIKKMLLFGSIIIFSANHAFSMDNPHGARQTLHDITDVTELRRLLSMPGHEDMVMARNSEGLWPIHVAARENRMAIVFYFIRGTIEIEELNITAGPIQLESLYWNRVGIDQPDSNGRTSLFHAVDGNAVQVIRFLSRNNAALNRSDNSRRSILHVLPNRAIGEIIFSDSRAEKQLLPLLNQPDIARNTPVVNAAMHNRDDVVILLLRYGAHITDTTNVHIVRSLNRIFQSAEPESRLMLGIMLNELRLVQDALEDCRIHSARTSGFASFASRLVGSVTGRSATQRLVNNEFLGIRPLVAAFQQGNMHIAALLIQEGADYGDGIRDAFDRTLTQIAAENAVMSAFLTNVRRYSEVDRAEYLRTVISQYAPFIELQRRGQIPTAGGIKPPAAAALRH